jgi:hypothetical protein
VTLVRLAKLEDARQAAIGADSELSAKWGTAAMWSEQMRYHRIDKKEAQDLYDAIADPSHGVLSWIKTHW